MQRKLLVLDSRYRINPEDKDGSEYKFKLNGNIKLKGKIRLEQFVFQNSQYVFSQEKNTNKFIYTDDDNDNKVVEFLGKFDNVDTFVQRFNSVMQLNSLPIRMIYTSYLYEIKIMNPNATTFELKEFGDNGRFLDLLGFAKINQGQNVYTNVNVPKIFSQSPIYISIPEIGTYDTITRNSRPFTFLVLSQPGFKVVTNINNTFENDFYVKDKDT